MGLLMRIGTPFQHSRSSVRLLSTFRHEDLQITLTSKSQPKPDYDTLKFGHTMTDHLLEIDWTEKDGWANPVIRPMAPFLIHPAAKVLHYATELFEGMKAYRCVDNKIRMFRPMENMNRMSQSAARTSLPAFDRGELLKCIKKLITLDQEWVPYSDTCSLYIRPTFIGMDPTLGVTYPTEAKLFTILCPVGPYFPTGMKPVSLLADPQYVRAWPGGSGNFKMGSNYAPTIKIQHIALTERGCQQVLWLYGDDHQMTEVGTMNLFVYWVTENGEHELITPPLESGLILPGVTRKSLLEVAREWNEFKVTEASLNMGTFTKALKEGRVKEVFGAGTACVVCPVERIVYQNQDLEIPVPEARTSLCQRFFREINDIHMYGFCMSRNFQITNPQYGRKPHSWMEPLDIEEEPLRTVELQ